MAALDLWEYSSESAKRIFGEATGNPEADRILEELRTMSPKGLTQTEISLLFGKNVAASKLRTALQILCQAKKVRNDVEPKVTGRNSIRWYYVDQPTLEVVLTNEINERSNDRQNDKQLVVTDKDIIL